jgi:MFS family permease
MRGQFALLGQRRFAPFFATQFLGASNDNIFKYAFTLLVAYHGAHFVALDEGVAINLIAGLFILPFLLFSATSGQIADKVDKARLMRWVKGLEVAIMLAGAWGLVHHSFAVLLGCTFLMGLHSTVFGPAKYAYLPAHLGSDEIVGGNGLVEGGTFIAILVGTIAGGSLIEAGGGEWLVAGTCVALAAAGLGSSMMIPPTPAADPALVIDFNPLRVTLDNLRIARREPTVFVALLGISWLWFFGAVFLTQFPQFAQQVLGGGPAVATLALTAFSIGIGAGSVLCERLSRHMGLGLVPLGALGMTAFTVELVFAIRGLPLAQDQGLAQFVGVAAHWRVLAALFLLAACAGLYSVPLYALIQTRCAVTHRARIIAANNILNALFLLLAAGFGAVALGVLRWSIPTLFLATAALNGLVVTAICVREPEFTRQLAAWLRRTSRRGTDDRSPPGDR